MTPPEEFFHAADEVGLFVMAELPAAYTQYVLPHRDFLRKELEDVVMAYRNRPSLLSLAFGNEFNLSWLETEAERKTFLDDRGRLLPPGQVAAPRRARALERRLRHAADRSREPLRRRPARPPGGEARVRRVLLFAARHLAHRQVHRRLPPGVAARQEGAGSASRDSRTSTRSTFATRSGSSSSDASTRSSACGTGRTSPATTTG